MNDQSIKNKTTSSGFDEPSGQRKAPAYQPLLFAGTLIAGMFIGTNLGDKNFLQVKPAREENPNKLVSLIDYIEDNYVDSINKSKLIDDAIRSVLLNLDPHSIYISPDEVESEQEKMRGEFEGIGIEFLILRDTLMVVRTLAEGPSEKAGLKGGDRIIQVNGTPITGKELNSDKAQKLLKGPRGTEVNVVISRLGEAKPLTFTIERGNIPIESVPTFFMVSDSVGYVKVDRFAQTTASDFASSVEKLTKKGCNKLIIDLRGNGGGLLDQATGIIEEFLGPDHVMLFTEGQHQGKEIYKSRKKGKFKDMEVVVMIDQGSASASEIVAGALQDWDRSVTVGRRSFGKGLVQHEMELADRSALRLTVARYYTPTGRCIQKPYGDSINYYEDFHQRLVNGELTNADSMSVSDSLKFTTPKGRTVYGGGGIVPDVFVPLDSIYFSGLLSDMAYSGVIRDYCFNYIDAHRKELNAYSADAFIEKYAVSDAMINELITAAVKQKIEINKSVLKKITPTLKSRIKAQIGRTLFDENTMAKIMLQSDVDFKKALQVALNYTEYSAIPENPVKSSKKIK
jgi:carboxyl-terminal processing protease